MTDWSRLTRLEAPEVAPLDLSAAKQHLRIYHDDEDEHIQLLLDAVIAFVEGPNGIGLALTPQKWRLSLDSFYSRNLINGFSPAYGYGAAYLDVGAIYSAISIPLGPTTSIEQVQYTDDKGDTYIVPTSDYIVDIESSPARISPVYGGMWPITINYPGAVKVDFTAGFSETPADLKAALLLLLGHWFENRENVVAGERAVAVEVPFTVDTILNKYRVGRFA
ncbi:head-tail connector protein [Rhizobium mayense]|uniref:head-tail connector protein n=1 Tax=Rhizobium mayense TaxID=1312184 RepID=UPI00398C7A19